MEHLPQGISSRAPRVPYVAHPPYDRLRFETFPNRVGWRIADDGTAEWVNDDTGGPQNATISRFAQFVQSWLYFGLLEEVLGDDPDFNVNDFIEGGGFNPRVTTKNLRIYLDNWNLRVTARSSNQRQLLIKAQLALEKARELVVRIALSKAFSSVRFGR
jgi:hypothetical protein